MFRPVRLLLSITLNLGLLLYGTGVKEDANYTKEGIYIEPLLDHAGRPMVVETVDGPAVLYRVMTKQDETDTVRTAEENRLILVPAGSVNEPAACGVTVAVHHTAELWRLKVNEEDNGPGVATSARAAGNRLPEGTGRNGPRFRPQRRIDTGQAY